MPGYEPVELVRWCQRTLPDDTRAFGTLISQYQGQVFATAVRLMGNIHDAEDITQDVFLKVFHGIMNLDEPATLPAWLTRITVNTCLNELKRQRRLRAESLLSPPEHGEPAWHEDTVLPTPEATVLTQELRACLEQTLAALNTLERTVLVLRDVEGYTYQEISKLLALSLSAVKMRIHRTRLAFRDLFDRICPDMWRERQPTHAP